MIRNEWMTDDSPPPRIGLTIDASLLAYLSAGMQRDRIAGDPLRELALFLADLRNDTPTRSKPTCSKRATSA